MEVIKNVAESPIIVVGDVVFELEKLSGLCFLLSQFQNNKPADTIALNDIGDCLDRQIKALDGIQWTQQKAVGA